MYTTKSRYRRANFDVNQAICWKMLSDDQCEEIFLTAQELLERSGAKVESKEALDIFAQGGCWVQGDKVRIPSAKLEWAIRTAPSRITLCDRLGQRAILMEAENSHYGASLYAENIVDWADGSVRPLVKDDLPKLAQLCQKLNKVDFITPGGVVADAPAKLASVEALAKLAANSAKPVIIPTCCGKQAAYLTRLAAAAVGGEEELRRDPYLVLAIESEQARLLQEGAASAVIFAAKNGVPFIFNTTLISGFTAPSATAGTIVAALANGLLALTLAQLTAAGAPVILGGRFSLRDDNSDTVPFAAPEAALTSAGHVNVLRRLGLPSAACGGVSGSCVSDAQYGGEATYSLTAAVLSGANLILGGGSLESGRQLSPAGLAMSDETVGQLHHIIQGVKIDEDRKAIGVYDEVGPGGYYLDQDHTTAYFKSEQYWPNLINRKRIDDWIAAGSKPLGQRAAEYVSELLAEPAPISLDQAAQANMELILADAQKNL